MPDEETARAALRLQASMAAFADDADFDAWPDVIDLLDTALAARDLPPHPTVDAVRR